MLVNLLFEIIAELKINSVTARHVWLQYPDSAYCSGYQTRTLRNSHEKATVILPETNFKILQRLFASVQFYSVWGVGRDFIIVGSSERHDGNDTESSVPLWFGKAPPFFLT